jgi:hypothetical protein
MRGSRSTQQTVGLTVGDLVVFDQTDNSTGSDITLNTLTGQITLAANRTYRLLAQVPTYTGSNNANPAFRWYNETTSSYIGSLSATYNPNATADFGAFGGLSEVIITTTELTVVSFRIVSIGATLSGLGGNSDFTTGGSNPWFDIEAISGNSPLVNGSSGTSGSSGSSGASGSSGTSGSSGSSGTSGVSGNAPVTGSWTLATGANTVSFTVTAGESYVMWVNGNIPSGIVNWNATVTLSNSNVPAIGVQYGWYYLAGNALELTSIPSQIVGTAGTISTSAPAVSNSNTFTFGITNNSGTSQTVYYGYTQI